MSEGHNWKGKGRQVSEYVHGMGEITIHFPNRQVICANCLFCGYDRDFRRYTCKLTHEQVIDPFATIGAMCPLTFSD